jgi:hypothetical protein
MFGLVGGVGCTTDPEPTDDDGGFTQASGTAGDTTSSGTDTAGTGDTGDGDGDTAAGDGDGSAGDGDGSTGDGDGSTGDGDGSTGDGDGTTGDGDGTSGDGDGTSGDGDGTSGDGDGTSGDGDGTSGDGDGDGCFDQDVTLTPIEPNVVLVLDKSGSMLSNTWSPTGGTCDGTCMGNSAACQSNADCGSNGPCQGIANDCETRWKTLYDVVSATATNFDGNINFGAALYPRLGVQSNAWGPAACATNGVGTGNIDVPVAAMNASNVISFLPADTSVVGDFGGATPAHDGMSAGLEHLRQLFAADPSIPAFAILVTDGAANCNT